MKVTNDLIKKLAKLAKINISAEKEALFTKDFQAIVSFVEQLNEVDTDGVAETSQVTGLMNVMRDDEVALCEIEKELLACTPHKITDNSIEIPKIM